MGRSSRASQSITITLLLVASAGVAVADDPVPADPDGGGEDSAGEPAPPAEDDSDTSLEPVMPALPEPKAEEEDSSTPFLFEVALSAEIGLDSGAAGDPISLAPDIRLVTLSFPAIAIIHSTHATTGFHGIGRGASLCLAGDTCDAFSPSVYHNVGLEVAKSIRSHGRGGPAYFVGVNRTSLSLSAGLMAVSFDPWALALKLGARAGYLSDGGLIFETSPNIHIGMSERDLIGDRLYVPVTAGIIVSERLALQGEVGIAAPIDGFGDNFRVPLSLNVLLFLTEKISAEVSFSFPAVVAGDAVGLKEFDARTLTLQLSYETIAGGG